MSNKIVANYKCELDELNMNDEREEPILSPRDEYEQHLKRRKRNHSYFWMLVTFEIVICIVCFTVLQAFDLHYRVTREIENSLTGKNHFLTGTYTGETDFGYFIGEGTFEYRTGSIYNGQLFEKDLNGLGVLKIPSEGTYDGEFRYSQKSGQGVFYWDDGTVYNGQWKNDKMEGQGTYTSFDNIVYVGRFEGNSFKSGKCSFRNETGDYVLDFKKYQISRIKITFADGTTYVGDCEGGVLSGTGKMTFANGDQYVGDYTDGQRDGNGVYTWKNGDMYDGAWKNDLISGTGKYTYSNGSLAQGQFKDGIFIDGSYTVSNSFGDYIFKIEACEATNVEMRLKSGTTYSGEMKDNKLSGSAQICYSNGDTYSGKVLNGYKCGQGTYTWKSGASYEGEWYEDRMEGSGTYFYPDKSTGYKLCGIFRKGVPNGECWYYVDTGESYKTDWSDGKCVKIYE